jgi:hypothetical protein
VANTDFELQHARMTVLHSERDDLRPERAALLSRSDVLLEHRKALLLVPVLILLLAVVYGALRS